jgi:hypothetical protein
MFDGERLPEGLEEMPPGPELARLLAPIDRDRLSGYDRVVLLKARARQIAYDQAEFYADINSIHQYEIEDHSNRDLFWTSEIDEMAASEIRAALTLTRRSADYHLDLAFTLRQRLPKVWVALRDGRIDLAKARVIINGTGHLEEDTARNLADLAVERAPRQTTGELGAQIRKLAFSIDPEAAKARYEQGVEERRVTNQANEDGTANLYGLQLPADRATAAMRRINHLARAAKAADDPRTMDQLRADVLLDLLAGRQIGHTRDNRGVIDLHVDLTTLAGLSENPGEIPGFGPVIADVARQVAESQPDSEWRYTITDPTGAVIHNETTRRRPSTSQLRHVEARNPTCVFPGCRMPASDCDLDHTHAWAEGGPTDTHNLAPLCRYDHRLKHQAGWKQETNRPGAYTWTSPLGHTYTVGPDPP